MSLRRLFENEVSSSAFQVVYGEWRIIGKFAQISMLDNGLFDIWLVAPGLEPLSTRKLNSIMKMFPQEAKFTVLTGEAYTQVKDKDVVLKSLSLLGIRKKRKLSPEAKEKLILRLEAVRAVLPLASTCCGVKSCDYDQLNSKYASDYENSAA